MNDCECVYNLTSELIIGAYVYSKHWNTVNWTQQLSLKHLEKTIQQLSSWPRINRTLKVKSMVTFILILALTVRMTMAIRTMAVGTGIRAKA